MALQCGLTRVFRRMYRFKNASLSIVGGGAGPAGVVQVRSDFRTTAFWQPDVVTGADGMATVKVIFPDSLTTWKATARAASSGNQFGQAVMALSNTTPSTRRTAYG